MAEFDDREHFIPLRKSDLLDLLLRDPKLAGNTSDQEGLKRLHTLTGAVFHFEYHEQLEHLKNMYAPFDPDNEMQGIQRVVGAEREKNLDELFAGVRHLLEKANFEKLSEEDLRKALEGSSDFGINMDVDFAVFERYEIYVRGDRKETRPKRHWLLFWKMVEKPIEVYKRFVLVCKMKKHPRLSKLADTEGVYLKIVKDIPKPDLEMMIPGGVIQMPLFQRIMLYGSMAAGGGYVLYSVLMALLQKADEINRAGVVGALLLLLGPLAVLGGFAFRQYSAFNNTKQKYTLQLAESQYFQTLDNNAGVLTRILDEAEEQECREVLLGYYFLWKYAPPGGWDEKTLDDTIEKYLEEKAKVTVDFEIGDSLEKLVRFNLVTKTGDKYQAAPLEKALEALDYRWDNYFQYNQG